MYKMKYKNKVINLTDNDGFKFRIICNHFVMSSQITIRFVIKITSQTLAQSLIRSVIVPIDC